MLLEWVGVSASPDVAGQDIAGDEFGHAVLTLVSDADLKEWSGDAQVVVDGETAPGKTMSVFDALEDLDSADVLDKLSRIHKP